ncbi:hypothetical protein BKA69DRAFT_1127004 [Paraphysoderma sedebokerense]|nr:hypothetical protein BKA69DRAFT_1127004 [Paraphysoderma sedebokerense]
MPLATRLCVNQVNVLVFGGVGAGKSSFFNTIDTALQGRLTQRAMVGTGTGSLTTELSKYVCPGIPRLVLWDTKGWDKNSYEQGELNYILDGNIPDFFDLSRPITYSVPGFNQKPTILDRIHVMLLLIFASSISAEYFEKMSKFRDAARIRNIPILALLTKIDKVNENIYTDVKNVYQSTAIRAMMEDVANRLGVSANCVLPVKNYYNELEPHIPVDCLALDVLIRVLFAAEDHFANEVRKKPGR